jgi:hypothetical protein
MELTVIYAILLAAVVVLVILLIRMAAAMIRGVAGLVRRLRARGPRPKRLVNRTSYRSSGRVKSSVFLPCAVLTLGISALLAAALHVSFIAGAYYPILMPVFASIPAAAMVYWAVSVGHCRNRRVGQLLGLTAGLVLYLGYYHVGLIQEIGVRNAYRVDRLPGYIVWRMQNTVIVMGNEERDVERNVQEALPIRTSFNACLSAAELGFVLAFVPFLGGVRAGRAYAEAHERWTDLFIAALPPGSGNAVMDSLEDGSLPRTLAQIPRTAIGYMQPYCEIAVEYAPVDEHGVSPSAVYLSIREIRTPGPSGTLNYYLSFLIFSRCRQLVRQCELTREEIASFDRLFPAFAQRALSGNPPQT